MPECKEETNKPEIKEEASKHIRPNSLNWDVENLCKSS